MNVKVKLTTYVAATDLMGGDGFNSSFLCRSFLNLTVKNYENWSSSNKVLPFGARWSGNYESLSTLTFTSQHDHILLSSLLIRWTHNHSLTSRSQLSNIYQVNFGDPMINYFYSSHRHGWYCYIYTRLCKHHNYLRKLSV